MYTILRYLYSLLLTIALPFILLRLTFRSLKAPAYRKRWLERLGVRSQKTAKGGILIHAVSVGEVVAALPLIKALQANYPQLPITVTTTTPTGSQRLIQSCGDSVNHQYIPYDLSWALHQLFVKVQPKMLIIMETELWPNLTYKCQQQQIPIFIVNGRISDRSIVGYQSIKPFISKMLQQVTKVFAQSDLDAERFVMLGLPAEKVEMTGNLKFDVQIPLIQQQLGVALKGSLVGRKVLVAASTHAGEEELILQAFAKIKQRWDDSLLILVPRHPERFNQVATLIETHGFNYERRSSLAVCTKQTAVLLGDTMGELNIFYAAADVAFVGGSLVPIGGHNLLEPAAAGIAIVTGTHTSNFKEISEKLLNSDALIVVQNVEQLVHQVDLWFSDPQAMQAAGVRALEVINQNHGATAKVIFKLSAYLCQSQVPV